MRSANRDALHEFLSHAGSISDDILDDAVEMLGEMPFILPILRERPEYLALAALSDFMVGRPASLDAKTAELIAVAAAAGAGAEACLKLHMKTAMKEGATRDEIYDTLLIASLIGKTKVLAPAFRIFAGVVPPDSGEKRERDGRDSPLQS
ncbi:MAG: carboxymuconolactone decarboxylase family protein [Methanoculleaceae archaeon]